MGRLVDLQMGWGVSAGGGGLLLHTRTCLIVGFLPGYCFLCGTPKDWQAPGTQRTM